MNKKICQHCRKEFTKKVNCSKKSWLKVKFCSIECKHEFSRIEIKCSTCGKIFKAQKSQYYYKSCSRKCKLALMKVNSKKLHDKIGPVIDRGNAKENMTKTLREKFKRGDNAHMKKQWKKGKWTGSKNPRWRGGNTNWRKENPGLSNAITVKYRCAKLKRTPSYANLDLIKKFYVIANTLNKITDEYWEVDHIIPLQGELVSGFHHENNLQIIPRKLNRKKHNHFKI